MIDRYLKTKEFCADLSAVIKLSLLFLIGFGNYRSVLVLIGFFLVRSFLTGGKSRTYIGVTLLPILLTALIFDFKCGQFWLPHSNNVILAAIAFLLIDIIGTQYINMIFEKVSDGYIFSYCKSCKFENIKLTSSCSCCGYQKQSYINLNDRLDYPYSESFKCQLPLFRTYLSSKDFSNLSLEEGESIFLSLKVGFGNGPYIDGQKRLCTNIVMTNINLIMMHRLPIHRGWRWREKIDLSAIENIKEVRKKISVGDRQAVKISANKHTYEIFLWKVNRSQDQFMKHYDAVKQHIVLMQKRCST